MAGCMSSADPAEVDATGPSKWEFTWTLSASTSQAWVCLQTGQVSMVVALPGLLHSTPNKDLGYTLFEPVNTSLARHITTF